MEDRIRLTLQRRGYRLEKCRRRDRQALGFGKYWVWDLSNHIVSVPGGQVVASADGPETAQHLLRRCGYRADEYAVSLDEISKWLEEVPSRADALQGASSE
jgi:hypothetical protein